MIGVGAALCQLVKVSQMLLMPGLSSIGLNHKKPGKVGGVEETFPGRPFPACREG